MLRVFLLALALDLIIFVIYTAVIIPIHEVGHMAAYRHYGVKSVIGFGGASRGVLSFYCKTLIWADNLIFVEDDKKDAIVSFAGAGASIIFCLCMYMIFPLNGLLLVILYEGMSGWFEIKEGLAINERIRQGCYEEPWYIESKESHEIFVEELSNSEYEGLIVPQIKTYIRCMGLDLKEFG